MASVYKRGRKLWVRLKSETGAWIRKPTPYFVGDETRARRYATTAQDKLDARREAGTTASPDIVRVYASRWIDKRRLLDLDWKNDASRLKHHVLPIIGGMRLDEVRTRHVIELFLKIRSARTVASRTVYNIYSVVAALFRDAQLDGLIDQTPCVLDERQLGEKSDSDPEWRAGAVFARAEVETFISDPRIPDDRQLVYALEFLAGVRTGEAAGLRWRHYDAAIEPLGQLTIAHSYSTRSNREKSTKTGAVRVIPVHPVLAEMLREWRAGWEVMHGRAPGPDDLLVPLPPAAAEARRARTGEPFRSHDYSGKKWREIDLPALGLRHRRHYDTRATFITLALEDGADPHVIETRVTHTRRTGSRSAFDGYNRGQQWTITCREVAKLGVVRRPFGTALSTGIESSSVNVVEAAGVEREDGSATITDGAASVGDQPDGADARESTRTDAVHSLSTELARAVLDGDHERARVIAERLLRLAAGERRSRM